MFTEAYTWALRRVFKFIVKRALGRALENELDVEQLDVALSTGTFELRDAILDCEYLRQHLGASAPALPSSGRVGWIRATVPWNALGVEPCVVEIGDVDVVLVPNPDRARASASNRERVPPDDETETSHPNAHSNPTPSPPPSSRARSRRSRAAFASARSTSPRDWTPPTTRRRPTRPIAEREPRRVSTLGDDSRQSHRGSRRHRRRRHGPPPGPPEPTGTTTGKDVSKEG